MKYKNVFYFSNINRIGGVESFYWYLAQKYKDHDITIFYKTGDEDQINRLSELVRVEKFKGQRIQCEKAFFNYTIDIIDHVDADEYYQVIHGDYSKFNIRPPQNPKITKYIGVSQLVCDTFSDLTGASVELAYNPIMVKKPKKVLNLISATRLSREKGKERMIKFGQMLDQKNIPYVWTIFTNNKNEFSNPNIVYMEPRLDITDYIANADYLVQLSDTEGYCFSVAEALCVGTPVIVTDCPVFKEIGVINGKNGFVLDFDMNTVPIDKIYKSSLKFTYEPKADRWNEVLAEGESTYKQELKKKFKMKSKRNYFDLRLNKQLAKGELFTADYLRAKDLSEHGFAEILEEGG